MDTTTEKFKEDVKKLLTKKALRLWEALEWNKEGVGNSEIGFYDLDPETNPKTIAKFLNKRAEEKIF